jgi:hypothetical protein
VAVEVLHDRERGNSVMVCTTTDWAFGPVFRAGEDAEDFLVWVREHGPETAIALGLQTHKLGGFGGVDPRDYPDRDLEALYQAWLRELDRATP